MTVNLSKSAASVQQVLSQQGLELKVIEMPASTRTVLDAAQTIGCEVAQIIKSLIFKTIATQQPILILTSGVNRVNEESVAQALGEKIGKADADFTREVTGFAIGGIPPIGHKQAITTFIDEDLLKFDNIWAAAGTPNAVFMLPSAALIELTQGSVIAVK